MHIPPFRRDILLSSSESGGGSGTKTFTAVRTSSLTNVIFNVVKKKELNK
jgi:hypothetical protein